MFRKNRRPLQAQMFTTVDSLSDKLGKRLEDSWAGVFYREFFSRINEEPFAVLFSQKDSRPNIPINVLVSLEALKSGFNWSDEDMYDAFCFDLQVRYALGYRNLNEGQFELRTVYNFRRRLSEHMRQKGENLFDKAFEQVTDDQISSFQLKTGKLRMDSSQIASNIRNLSRLHLLVEVLQRVHRMMKEGEQEAYAGEFTSYMRGNSGQYVYRVKGEDGAEHMQRIGELMGKLLVELAESYEEHLTYQMMKRVFTEHFVVEQERVRLKASKDLRSDSLQSPDDLEASFITKRGKSYKGYVTNVSETCDPDNDMQLIVKVQTERNLTNDDDMLIEAVPSLKERMGVKDMHTDGGYNSDESYQVLRENQITHVQTALRGHSAQVWLGLDNYEITTSTQDKPVLIKCPHGQTVEVKRGQGKETYNAYFDREVCSSCPFSDKCRAKAHKQRQIRALHFDQHDVEIARRRRRIMRDREERRNLRVTVESTIASLKNPFCGSKLPVRGLFRIGMMVIGSAVMANIRRIHRYLAGSTSAKRRNTANHDLLRGLRQEFLLCLRKLNRCSGLVNRFRCSALMFS